MVGYCNGHWVSIDGILVRPILCSWRAGCGAERSPSSPGTGQQDREGDHMHASHISVIPSLRVSGMVVRV